MLTVGSLFSGAGGIDLGFQQAGLEIIWHAETNRQASALLEKHFPGVPNYGDCSRLPLDSMLRPDILCGGDPCPEHSRATEKAKSPDMSGHFLNAIGQLRPRYVVRENVRNPAAVSQFDRCMWLLGYGSVVIQLDAVNITCQSRKRSVIVGCLGLSRTTVRGIFPSLQLGEVCHTTMLEERQVLSCLLKRDRQLDSRDNAIYDKGRLRVPDSREREKIAGFPDNWTEGFSIMARARLTGNAAIPEKFRYIGTRIREYEEQRTAGIISEVTHVREG